MKISSVRYGGYMSVMPSALINGLLVDDLGRVVPWWARYILFGICAGVVRHKETLKDLDRR